MKRFILFPICSLFALMTLNSCQKEDKTALELTEELTAELRTVTDHASAEKAAPKIKSLNDRCRRARITLLAFNSTALARVYDPERGTNDQYVKASIELAREIGRVRASKPMQEGEETVDENELLIALGLGEDGNFGKSRAALAEAGNKYLQNDADEAHDNPPSYIGECYRSAALAEALEFNPDAGSELPEPEPAAEEGGAAAEEKSGADGASADSSDEVSDGGFEDDGSTIEVDGEDDV
ncbi:MAG: hypothetical protein LUE08_03095 [Akkermansiaceae bacterium]|nr:hypothetical protein [Akkermansiaceae bacterium]